MAANNDAWQFANPILLALFEGYLGHFHQDYHLVSKYPQMIQVHYCIPFNSDWTISSKQVNFS